MHEKRFICVNLVVDYAVDNARGPDAPGAGICLVTGASATQLAGQRLNVSEPALHTLCDHLVTCCIVVYVRWPLQLTLGRSPRPPAALASRVSKLAT